MPAAPSHPQQRSGHWVWPSGAYTEKGRAEGKRSRAGGSGQHQERREEGIRGRSRRRAESGEREWERSGRKGSGRASRRAEWEEGQRDERYEQALARAIRESAPWPDRPGSSGSGSARQPFDWVAFATRFGFHGHDPDPEEPGRWPPVWEVAHGPGPPPAPSNGARRGPLRRFDHLSQDPDIRALQVERRRRGGGRSWARQVRQVGGAWEDTTVCVDSLSPTPVSSPRSCSSDSTLE